MVGSDATRVWTAGWTAGGCTEVGCVERGVLGWFEVEWGVVCEWDVPVSMLGKSLKVAVCLSGSSAGLHGSGWKGWKVVSLVGYQVEVLGTQNWGGVL